MTFMEIFFDYDGDNRNLFFLGGGCGILTILRVSANTENCFESGGIVFLCHQSSGALVSQLILHGLWLLFFCFLLGFMSLSNS